MLSDRSNIFSFPVSNPLYPPRAGRRAIILQISFPHAAGEPRLPDLVLCDLRLPGGAAGLRDADARGRRPPHPPHRRHRLLALHQVEEETGRSPKVPA